MPLVTIDVDAQDVLDELDDEELEKELQKRRGKPGRLASLFGAKGTEAWTPDNLADDLRSAFYARDASRFEALLHRLAPPELRVPATNAVAEWLNGRRPA